MKRIATLILLLIPMVLVSSSRAQDAAADTLIARILEVDQAQRSQVKDLVLDAKYVEIDSSDNGETREKVRLIKKISIKYLTDTAWYHEEYLQFFDEGKLKNQDDLKKEADERKEKKRRRGALDISYPMLRPFDAGHRALYTIEYKGLTSSQIDGHVCHHFTITAKEPADSLINGDYYFESGALHLVRVDFSPSKLVRRTMFKMSEFNMSLSYKPNESNYWLPSKFHIQFKAKAMWMIGIKVNGTEDYTNPVVNSGISDAVFDSDKPKEK
jgi:hypothetical protein